MEYRTSEKEIDDLIGEERQAERKLNLKWIPVSIYFFKSSIPSLSTLGQFSGFERWTLCETAATWGGEPVLPVKVWCKHSLD